MGPAADRTMSHKYREQARNRGPCLVPCLATGRWHEAVTDGNAGPFFISFRVPTKGRVVFWRI